MLKRMLVILLLLYSSCVQVNAKDVASETSVFVNTTTLNNIKKFLQEALDEGAGKGVCPRDVLLYILSHCDIDAAKLLSEELLHLETIGEIKVLIASLKAENESYKRAEKNRTVESTKEAIDIQNAIKEMKRKINDIWGAVVPSHLKNIEDSLQSLTGYKEYERRQQVLNSQFKNGQLANISLYKK